MTGQKVAAPVIDLQSEIAIDNDALELAGEELQQLRADSSTLVIDVREQMECSSGIIPGAHLMPLSEIHRFLPSLREARSIVAYSQHGERSLRVAALLKSMGINAKSLCGGYVEWKKSQT